MAPLALSLILKDAGLDPASVRLVRHRDRDYNDQLCAAALARSPAFDQYQSGQRTEVFRGAKFLCCFVVDRRESTVFVGTFRINGVKRGSPGDPFRGRTGNQGFTYELRRTRHLDDLFGRLVVDWGLGARAWVQRADRRHKAIVEIRREIAEPPYPGHLNLVCRLSEVPALRSSWVEALRTVRGVYLLTDRKTGRQYVGSAVGTGGFYSRWSHYARSGHGGNVRLRELEAEPARYDATILEVAGSAASEVEILGMEARWKRKLGSRVHGLNAN